MAVTIEDVKNLSSTEWNQLSDDKIQSFLNDAQTERNTIYSERFSNLPTLDGDEDIFIKNLAAHKCELSEGGQSQSENTQGGSTTYDNPQGNVEQYLSLTRYGITCLEHVRMRQSIGIVRPTGGY